MKKYLFTLLFGLLLPVVALAQTITNDYPMTTGIPGVTTLTVTGGSDTNAITMRTRKICGTLDRIVVLGTQRIVDTNFALTLADEDGVSIFSKSGLSSANLPTSWAITSKDLADTNFAGYSVCGPLTITLTDINCPNEVQHIVLGAVATDGNFTMTYAGSTTALIVYNAQAATVNTALNTAWGTSYASVAFSGGTSFSAATIMDVTFKKSLGNVAALTMDITGLTGPATATITESKAGGCDIEPAKVKLYYQER